MQPVQSCKFSKTPLLLFAFGLIVSLAGCAQPPSPLPKEESVQSQPIRVRYVGNGLHGYIGSYSYKTPASHRYGASFYSSVWSLIAKPIANFQIGLPGTWFVPDNLENSDTPLCPVGTRARDNWPERAPTYQDGFQTMEGGLGY